MAKRGHLRELELKKIADGLGGSQNGMMSISVNSVDTRNGKNDHAHMVEADAQGDFKISSGKSLVGIPIKTEFF